MPEAIATTKRKFYKALDALTSSSQVPPPPINGGSSTPSTTGTKRSSSAAFDEARERVRKRLRQSTSTTSLSTLDRNAAVISLGRQPLSKDKTATSKTIPNFSPWSQEAFLTRLKTFSSVSLWHPKPKCINEVEWAKRGWVCVEVNTVACRGGCGKRVVVSLTTPRDYSDSEAGGSGAEENDAAEDDEAAAELEEALSERYKSMIVDGHSSSCLWSSQGCSDDIYRLQVVRPSVWQPELCKRLHSLLAINDSIVEVKCRPVDGSAEKLLYQLPKEMLGLSEPTPPNSGKAFNIAMHGWRGSYESGIPLLHCDACFQRVGLWMYQPEYLQNRAKIEDSEGDDVESSAIIDLIEVHRDHCPWRNPHTQHATGSLSGLNACQILHRVVSTAARDHRRRSDRQSNSDVEEPDAILPSTNAATREEIAKQDKERESRLSKLRSLFNIKRRLPPKTTAQKVA